MRKTEPVGITPDMPNYSSALARAFNWYHAEVDRKEARGFIRNYVISKQGREPLKFFDRIPETHIKTTYGWLARLIVNGNVVKQEDLKKLDDYVSYLFTVEPAPPKVVVADKPTVRDNMREKVQEYLGELEHAFDNIIKEDQSFDLRKDMQARGIPAPYVPLVQQWLKKKANEFIFVYETKETDVKEGYSNISKRKLTSIIKALGQWLEDLDSYNQFKKANRKPRAKKVKPPGVQVQKLKYKKEDTELGIRSVNPVEIVGSSQVWIYNTKYKRLSVYRSDSAQGIQVKGTALQNYDPDQCEQKALRKPKDVIKTVLSAGKVQLRKILGELSTKESQVTGRINEECIIVRVIK